MRWKNAYTEVKTINKKLVIAVYFYPQDKKASWIRLKSIERLIAPLLLTKKEAGKEEKC